MRYYLETNALRALGSNLVRNPALLKDAFTSTFAIFELIKKIGRGKDGGRRIGVFKALLNSEIKIRDIMPEDLIPEAYGWKTSEPAAAKVHNAMAQIIENIQEVSPDEICNEEDYKELIEHHESGAQQFQEALSKRYTGPMPEPETFLFSLVDAICPLEEVPSPTPEHIHDKHPAYIFIDSIRDRKAIKTYRALDLPDSTTIEDAEILRRYDKRLDLFFYATEVYEMMKDSMRGSPEKNDMMDLLHIVYLHNNDIVIVSNDKLFEHVLPSMNRMTLEEFQSFQLNRAEAEVSDTPSVESPLS